LGLRIPVFSKTGKFNDIFWLNAEALYEGPSPAGAVFPNNVNAPAMAIINTMATMSILYMFFIFSPFYKM